MEQGGPEYTQPAHQMCPIHNYFKRFQSEKTKDFPEWCKVSSIMQAKVLSIMRTNAEPVTTD
jgi:hypothetical protein